MVPLIIGKKKMGKSEFTYKKLNVSCGLMSSRQLEAWGSAVVESVI